MIDTFTTIHSLPGLSKGRVVSLCKRYQHRSQLVPKRRLGMPSPKLCFETRRRHFEGLGAATLSQANQPYQSILALCRSFVACEYRIQKSSFSSRGRSGPFSHNVRIFLTTLAKSPRRYAGEPLERHGEGVLIAVSNLVRYSADGDIVHDE